MSVTVHTNSDGLIQKYGTSEAKSLQQGGFICTYGGYHTVVLNLDLTTLTTSEVIQNDVLVVPKNSLIESVEVITIEAAADGTDIDVGLIANDRTTTTDLNGSLTDADPDGLLVGFPATEMSEAGEYSKFWTQTAIPAAATGSGALLGTILTVPTLITASADGTFTAGRIQLRVNTIPMALTGFGEVH